MHLYGFLCHITDTVLLLSCVTVHIRIPTLHEFKSMILPDFTMIIPETGEFIDIIRVIKLLLWLRSPSWLPSWDLVSEASLLFPSIRTHFSCSGLHGEPCSCEETESEQWSWDPESVTTTSLSKWVSWVYLVWGIRFYRRDDRRLRESEPHQSVRLEKLEKSN